MVSERAEKVGRANGLVVLILVLVEDGLGDFISYDG